jgi:hypothetical protein
MSIGGTLAEARHEAGLTVADVSARTRIRQALIRDIERDEFTSCGGDFYARGHIRAIAGVVGTDPRPLISEYDATHCPGGPVPRPAVPAASRAARTDQAGLDDLLTPALPEPPHTPGTLHTPGTPGPPGPPPGRSRYDWLVPVVMLAVIVGVVTLAYRLTDGKDGSQPPAASPSHRASARTATTSPSERPSPSNTRRSSTATPPTTNGFPVTQVTPVSAAAVGPAGTSDGDNGQDASLALSGDPATPWQTNWYTTARFGNLQEGTGLLVDLGRTVTATGVTIHLGSPPGANLQVRAGTSPAGLHTVASANNAGGAVKLSLASHPHVRYVLIWFTLLPPDSSGTYRAAISSVTVTASAR